jgi:signal transduction histidine kinase
VPLAVNVGLNAVWVAVAAAGLAAADPAVKRAATRVGAAVGLAVAPVWLWFVASYANATGVRVRRALWGVGAVGLALVVAVATDALHRSYFADLTVVADPFPYVVATRGPLGYLGPAYVAFLLVVGAVPLCRLFVTSRHRSSWAAGVLLAGAALGTAPVALSVGGATPLPGYNHAPLGVTAYATCVAVAAFGTGLPDLSTAARDRRRIGDDCLLAVDTDGTVVDHTRNAAVLAGSDRDGGDPNPGPAMPDGGDGAALAGQPLAAAFPAVADALETPADREGPDGLAGTIDGDEAGAPPTVTVERAGQTRHYAVRTRPLWDRGTDRRLGSLLSLRDVTALEASRRRLARQNDHLDRVASVATHELRNPLAVLNGYLDTLATDLSDADQPTRDRVEHVRQAADRLCAVVDDLGRLTEPGHTIETIEPVRLDRAVEQARATVAADLSVEVDGAATIMADPSVFETLLENLLSNAADHAGPSPTVTVGATERGFYVADDGPGVPEEHRDRVFRYGHSTADGSGIGLALVRRIAAAHGWTVDVVDAAPDGDSVEAGQGNAGARFEFEGVQFRDRGADGDGTDTDGPVDGSAPSRRD